MAGDLIDAALTLDARLGPMRCRVLARPTKCCIVRISSLRLGLAILIFMLLTAGLTASSEEPLAALIARAESARMEARPPLYTAIAERQLLAADQLYSGGKVDEARAAVSDVVTYSDKAHDAASKSRSKLKPTEILLRKMAAKLRDIKRTLPFEEQAAVQDAADHLERLRTDLLARMFSKGEK
jgi:hypothetical protein